VADDSFKKWYTENRDRLAETRRKRYAEDATYREQVKARSADARDRKRAETPKVGLTGLSIAEVCESLDISEWTLNSWRNRGYYPEPRKEGQRPVFTYDQLTLLQLIREFFQTHPRRVAGLHREELGVLVDVIHHNWKKD